MKFNMNETYVIKSKGKEVVDVFLEYLGFQKNNKPCFLIWSQIDKTKTFTVLGNYYVKRIKKK